MVFMAQAPGPGPALAQFPAQALALAQAGVTPGSLLDRQNGFWSKQARHGSVYFFFQDRSAAFFKAQLWSEKKSGSILDPKVDILARGRFGSKIWIPKT